MILPFRFAAVSMTGVVDLLIAILQTWTGHYPVITVSLTVSPGERRVQLRPENLPAPDCSDTDSGVGPELELDSVLR